MGLLFLTRLAREQLRAVGRPELAEEAVGWIGLTDDGSTLYVHLRPRQGWRGRLPGEAYVLAHADYPEVRGLAGVRVLLREARAQLLEDLPRIARWLQGREPPTS